MFWTGVILSLIFFIDYKIGNDFSTVFTSLNGLKPWDYITIRRIEKSKSILKDTDLPIIEIADKCGYDNISYFNRMFKRITGFSPTEYRKSKRTINKINTGENIQ